MKIITAKRIIMRINLVITLLLSFALSTFATNMLAQTITLKMESADLKDVFSSIRKQTSYNFIYTNSLLDKANKVNIEVKDMPLSDALERCFDGQPLSYKLSGTNIVLTAKTPETVKTTKSAQETVTLSGTISLQTMDGVEPADGASIRGVSASTSTDENGRFSLNVRTNERVRISLLGYTAQEVIADHKRRLAHRL